MPKAPSGRAAKKFHAGSSDTKQKTLNSAGISRQDASEYERLAEARIGEMSKTLKSEQGARNDFVTQGNKVVGKSEILKSAGISRKNAAMYERLAELPKEELAKAIGITSSRCS